MSIFNSFFHRTWLSIVGFAIILLLIAQAFYMQSVNQVHENWEILYNRKIDHLISDIVKIAQTEGVEPAIEHIYSLPKEDQAYFSLYYVSQELIGRNTKTNSFVFDINNDASMQLIYFTDAHFQPLLLEVKNTEKNSLFFSPTWSGFLLRSFPIFIFALLFAYFWTRRSIAPILTIANVARNIARGNRSIRLSNRLTRLPNEIGELALNFNNMIEGIDTLQRDQQRMLSDVAHELRSPLSRQKLAIDLLKNVEPHSDRFNELMDRIENEGDRLNELIEEVMNYLRPIENKPDADKYEDIALAPLVEAIIEDANFEYSQQNKTIVPHFITNPVISGNYLKIERAIENIIRNALFYTHEGTSVYITLSTKNHHALLTVIDQGDGVPEDSLPFLKMPFYRTDNARNKTAGGYGLGLSLTDTIINQHQGTLTFENNPPSGLKVTITLPFSH